ncbi:3-isopropylmalate dehydratase small subunit [Pseudalkalibacillus caeni]|uniref:3-isopropylmalate dehydratase small subunit n=1 Tax=Exobacillus caeni TaxID=2574798 RepID=A0A5R9EX19_9BACL|nr:3-isopropylmalate dehydratase small subunit [Pseudalkalibacillus caeni]TLS35607.1 3-isopropylmalate dehydratase small subunit [Pseudalkalibacillus caeni]
MKPFDSHTGKVVPLDAANVDTDAIIPKQFLKRIQKTGFGQFLFYDWRFEDGKENEDFILNKPEYKDASILLARKNFGCGSSREHAPWALEDYGFRVIIAPSFADIFYNNSFKNGILPISLENEQINYLFQQAEDPEYQLSIDLKNQTVKGSDGFSASFEIDDYRKWMLMKGLDEIGSTLINENEIGQYEKQHKIYYTSSRS